jgi:hypothetical protein
VSGYVPLPISSSSAPVTEKRVAPEDVIVTVADEQAVNPGNCFLVRLDDVLLAIESATQGDLRRKRGKITSVPGTAKPGEMLP